MANLKYLESKINSVVAAINQIIQNSKGILQLDDAPQAVQDADYIIVSQNGLSYKTQVSSIAGDKPVNFQDFKIFKASGNTAPSLESGDIIQGWWDNTEFILARFNGGDPSLKSNYTILNTIQGL